MGLFILKLGLEGAFFIRFGLIIKLLAVSFPTRLFPSSISTISPSFLLYAFFLSFAFLLAGLSLSWGRFSSQRCSLLFNNFNFLRLADLKWLSSFLRSGLGCYLFGDLDLNNLSLFWLLLVFFSFKLL